MISIPARTPQNLSTSHTSNTHGTIMAPNAGVDISNADGKAILYPLNPYRTAEHMRRKIFLLMGTRIGVILADSRLMPTRVGTIGVAIASAGFEPVRDMRSKEDLDGNPLKVTFQAVADSLATVANYTMGEAAESKPFVILRCSGAVLTNQNTGSAQMAVPPDQCVYVRGLSSL